MAYLLGCPCVRVCAGWQCVHRRWHDCCHPAGGGSGCCSGGAQRASAAAQPCPHSSPSGVPASRVGNLCSAAPFCWHMTASLPFLFLSDKMPCPVSFGATFSYDSTLSVMYNCFILQDERMVHAWQGVGFFLKPALCQSYTAASSCKNNKWCMPGKLDFISLPSLAAIMVLISLCSSRCHHSLPSWTNASLFGMAGLHLTPAITHVHTSHRVPLVQVQPPPAELAIDKKPSRIQYVHLAQPPPAEPTIDNKSAASRLRAMMAGGKKTVGGLIDGNG
eukprot:1138851-Pelagomonas_calceolata.AAC.3